jgi:hypothetical protein
LIDDLIQLNAASKSGTLEDEEMLSLIVEDACQGVDISKRYPAFYQKLLHHSDLRQAFLDILDSLDDEETIRMPWAEETEGGLGFLAEQPSRPVVTKLPDHWKASWQRTIAQLQALFTPSALVYRADPALSEDLWFMLLRDEIEIENVLYTILLECTFSEEEQEGFSPWLDLAVTVGAARKQAPFPIRITLQWGDYEETVHIGEEGRVKLPTVPLLSVFDKQTEHVISELNLTVESIA